jgi:hypothetical protein
LCYDQRSKANNYTRPVPLAKDDNHTPSLDSNGFYVGAGMVEIFIHGFVGTRLQKVVILIGVLDFTHGYFASKIL